MVEVLGVEAAVLGVVAQGDLAGCQHLAVVAAQEGHQQLAAQQRVVGAPLDVEELRVGAAPAPFEHVEPPGVVVTAHRHVVGDDVEDQPHALLAQGGDQALERRLAPSSGLTRVGSTTS